MRERPTASNRHPAGESTPRWVRELRGRRPRVSDGSVVVPFSPNRSSPPPPPAGVPHAPSPCPPAIPLGPPRFRAAPLPLASPALAAPARGRAPVGAKRSQRPPARGVRLGVCAPAPPAASPADRPRRSPLSKQLLPPVAARSQDPSARSRLASRAALLHSSRNAQTATVTQDEPPLPTSPPPARSDDATVNLWRRPKSAREWPDRRDVLPVSSRG